MKRELQALYSYDIREFDFASLARSALDVADLGSIHERWQAAESVTRTLYAKFDDMLPTYEKFVHAHAFTLLGSQIPMCFQSVPTFRVHLPYGKAVEEFHVDTRYHHQVEVLNIWLPLTPAFASNTIWVESIPGAADYSPVSLDVGDYFAFRATRLGHGNVRNETGRTRISFDLRIIPLAQFRDDGRSTVRHGIRLNLGAYYAVMNPDGTVEHRPDSLGAR